MNLGAYQGFSRGNVTGGLEKMYFGMLFKCGKGLWITSGIVWGIADRWFRDTEIAGSKLLYLTLLVTVVAGRCNYRLLKFDRPDR